MSEHILDSIELGILGQRLQQARKRQGLTQADAAHLIQVGRTTMTAIEKGERRIKAGELRQLAEAYGRPVSYFVHDRPEVNLAQVQLRSTSSLTTEDEELIAVAVDTLVELSTNYVELEQFLDRSLPYHYPPIYQYGGLRTAQAAEGLAIAERNRLGLGDAPIPILRDILEKEVGLRIFYLPLKPSGKIAEVYFFQPILGGCIAINQLQTSSPGRCRWSLAHAYAHFLAHRNHTTVTLQNQYQRKPERERFADDFAAYFLMPTNGVTQRFNVIYHSQGRVTPADLLKLAHYYGVSFRAMVLRLEDMRLIPSGVWEKLHERGFKVREAEVRLGLDPIAEPIGMLPERYERLAIAAYHAGEISEGELAHYLQTDRLDARTRALHQEAQIVLEQGLEQDVRVLISA